MVYHAMGRKGSEKEGEKGQKLMAQMDVAKKQWRRVERNKPPQHRNEDSLDMPRVRKKASEKSLDMATEK